jgi:UDP-GlcNAc:undecaprenyl-phosphate/decaprenyl-phosphate GlcNAc-1-phosphate transferase
VREYALVCCIAAAVTFLLTPVVRVAARRWGAVARPRDRDVHAIPTPRWGGVAMYAGMAVALLVAQLMPTLRRAYDTGSETTALLVAGGLICLLGILDDRWELDSLTKLAGQVFSAGVMVLLGVQLLTLYVPFGGVGTLSFGRNDSVGLTVVLCLLTINAINFIDGLDGLAAGVSAISALAFFAYSYHLSREGYNDVAFAPSLFTAVLAGACLGFLPHNFSPARIFMGDSGSMLIGLTLAASAISASTGADTQTFAGSAAAAFPMYLPFLLPLVVLAVPLVDLVLAVVRRVGAGRSPFAPDKLHLHHRLLEIGHSHRRAVLLIYFWSALLGFGGVAMSIVGDPLRVLSVVAGLAAVAIVLSSVPRLRAARRLS